MPTFNGSNRYAVLLVLAYSMCYVVLHVLGDVGGQRVATGILKKLSATEATYSFLPPYDGPHVKR